MKLTKQTEAEILEAYHTFWEVNLAGDLKGFASYMLDSFSIFGTANGEAFYGKEDAMNFYTATVDQLAGKVQLRNREISLQGLDTDTVLVREQSDVYALIQDEWTFYGHARISCILKHTGEGWKGVHQHASFPDHRTEEGQQIAAEKIAKENLELREAVKRRTAELEHKNRELEIEAAVEKVRAQSLAMYQTNDLAKVNEELFAQLTKLNIEGFTGVAIYLVDEDEMVTAWDLSSPGSMGDATGYAFKYDPKKCPVLGEFVPVWRAAQQDYFILDYPKGRLLLGAEELEPFYPAMAESFRTAINSGALQHQWNATARIANGVLSLDMMKPPTEEVKPITLKMAAAFNLAYQRFLDLQKAEAQARESKIEAALEKVRSRSMAMHKSEELKEVIQVVYEQFIQLNIEIEHTGFIINYKQRDDMHIWLADQFASPFEITIPYFDSPHWNSFITAKKKGKDFFANLLSFDEKNKFYRDLFKLIPPLPEEAQQAIFSKPGLAISTVLLDSVGLYIENFSATPFTDEENYTLMRFGKAFQQAYTRFLDLQKAEQQTREAQINLAVERVRARALAMHNSTQILDVVTTLRNEMLGLEIPGVVAATIYLREEEEGYIRMWDLSSITEKDDGFHVALDVKFKLDETDPGLYMRKVWHNDENYFVEKQEAKDMAITLEWLRQYYPQQADEVQQFLNTTPWKYLLHPTIQLAHGKMSVDILDTEPPAEMESIMLKMGAAFDLAYKRFEDLKNSEAQLREGQIELSLERIRARVTAMKVSSDLLDIVVTMRTEFVALGHEAHYVWHMKWQPDIYEKAMTSGDGTRIGNVMTLPRYIHGNIPLIANWEKSDEPTVVYAMDAEAAVDYVEKMITLGNFEQVDHNAPTLDDIRHIGGLTFIMARTTHGEIGFSLPGVVPNPPADDVATLVRFAAVFDLAYRRFEDLKSSERQIREAQIELALERVRARTMAMRQSNELADAAAILFQQVKNLSIETYTSGFNIWDEEHHALVSWMSNPAGVINPPFIMPAMEYGQHKRFYEAWKSNLQFIEDDLTGEKIIDHYKYLRSFPLLETAFATAEKAGIKTPDRQVHNVVFFSHGYLLFVTLEPKPEFQDLFKRFGQVFQQTYTRFLDLQRAEAQTLKAEQDLVEIMAARKKAEEALTELQSTQKQLIQSEKMASLGELTAGIAHEIQNPLNFVTNFSDVSKELMDEMREELEKGNVEEASAMAGDVIQNLEKILHHGKRAGDIVKGMLQHSRTSSGQKEPADINALADEYLRLAYHGLRAKDKTFNATTKTGFDESIGLIKIIPQDIGRVILNLITNAFYAVSEKKKSAFATASADKYEPTVSVSTKREMDKVEIKVKDNGNGIPEKILDKIFQPFFTTKPTGQGTGLGLSLSYDIIKAHGGDLKVETKEREETTFIIQLPVSKTAEP